MDISWYLTINDFARSTPWLHSLGAQYALWGGLALLAVLLIAGWLWARRQPDAPDKVAVAVLTGVGVIAVLVINQHLISPAIARARPCRALANVEVLLTCTNDYSMPSDHCILAGAFVAGLWVLNRKFGIVAAILAALLAFSRIYSGVHYPSDTLVGLAAGLVIGLVIVLVLRRPVRALCSALTRTPAAVLITAEKRGRQPALR